ncbi:hypothetical protein [Mycobacterium sp. C31M]
MQNPKLLVVALALAGMGFVGAGAAFAESPAPLTTIGTTVLADNDWDDWYDDDWDDRWDD